MNIRAIMKLRRARNPSGHPGVGRRVPLIRFRVISEPRNAPESPPQQANPRHVAISMPEDLVDTDADEFEPPYLKLMFSYYIVIVILSIIAFIFDDRQKEFIK